MNDIKRLKNGNLYVTGKTRLKAKKSIVLEPGECVSKERVYVVDDSNMVVSDLNSEEDYFFAFYVSNGNEKRLVTVHI